MAQAVVLRDDAEELLPRAKIVFLKKNPSDGATNSNVIREALKYYIFTGDIDGDNKKK